MKYTEQQKQIYNDVCDKYKHNWLNTTISQTMAMEMISKALNIHNVSQERELLRGFMQYVNCADTTSHIYGHLLEDYLKTL
jgi:Fe-S cluster biosynthesis and repair protein YggX